MRYLLSLIAFLILTKSTLGFSESGFYFEDLVYMINGKDLGSDKVPVYENLDVGIKGLQGYLIEDGLVELGMEVVITDVNSNRLLYSPDMLVDSWLTQEEVKRVHFNIDLNEDFRQGEEYFIKIKIWDKNTQKSYSKHSSFTVSEAIKNEHVYIDVRRLKVGGYKFYLNADRVYKTNYIRLGDELVIDMFFKELEFEENEDIIILTEIIDEQNSKKLTLENEYVIADKTEDLKSVLIKTNVFNTSLIFGESYIFHMQFHNASRNQKLDLKYRFTLLDSGWQSEGVKVGGVSSEVQKNKEKCRSNPVLEIGDRLDFQIYGFEKKQRADFGFGKIGGELKVYDSDSKLVSKSRDVYAENGIYLLNEDRPIEFKYVVPSSLDVNEKYTLEFTIWDKYGNSYATRKFKFKTAKKSDLPFGLQDNLHLKCNFLSKRIQPISVYVSRNGYKTYANNLHTNDFIEMITSVSLAEDYKPKALERYTELYDEKGNLLIRDQEDMTDFRKGEVLASMQIPEFGVEFNRNYTLITLLKDGEEEVLKVEYKFYVER